ncbi:MAG: leucyl aminopeptidase [Pseudomonadales bacterium]|nr:leucyl aminopeptidase [Pseudomonadales bacterium]
MEYGTRSGDPTRTRTQCLVVGVFEENRLSATANLLDKASDGYIRKVLRRGDIQGKAGQTLVLHDVPGINAARILLTGLGKADNIDAARFLQITTATINAIKSTKATNALCCLLDAGVKDKDTYWTVRRIVEGFEAGTYQFDEMRGKPPENGTALETVDIYLADQEGRDDVNAAIDDGVAVAIGVAAARDLGNMPSNICTASYLADAAKKLAKDYDSITTTILEEKDMEKLGMGALLSVSQGSDQPAKLIVIQHKGAKASDAPHVLVGKGITFDTGGISLKPAATMYEMIYDMCGAASVFGAMTTVAEQKLPANIIGVIAAAENMPSGKASRPGDIVTTMSGQTVEILNTDAEGRLVLCDALTYIGKFKPATVVDIATLTGACVIALGSHASALYANDEELAGKLLEAGETTRDRAWRMPLWEDYQTQLKSAFADVANIGGREAGSITAACFLARFTKKYRWAHLDIAGTAYKANANKGSTGRPVGLLTQYLMDRARNE